MLPPTEFVVRGRAGNLFLVYLGEEVIWAELAIRNEILLMDFALMFQGHPGISGEVGEPGPLGPPVSDFPPPLATAQSLLLALFLILKNFVQMRKEK